MRRHPRPCAAHEAPPAPATDEGAAGPGAADPGPARPGPAGLGLGLGAGGRGLGDGGPEVGDGGPDTGDGRPEVDPAVRSPASRSPRRRRPLPPARPTAWRAGWPQHLPRAGRATTSDGDDQRGA